MHNRVRMITSSFFGKKFTYALEKRRKVVLGVSPDADAASNSASWQWVAGTGTDSTPFLEFLILLRSP